jgi:hypothetical protein
MRAFFERSDLLLRPEQGLNPSRRPGEIIRQLLVCVCLYGLTYGTVMGSFGGISGDHAWQMLYSATKVPLLLLGTFLICLPSFFVLNTVAGLRSDFRNALQALLATQAAMTIVLCSLAPFTALWYFSSGNYHSAVLCNGVAFAASSSAAQAILRRLYRPLIRRNRRHILLLRIWLASYIFVGIQLGWLLRPFVGEPGSGVQLFRENAWGNAYVEVLHHIAGLTTQ